MAYDRLRNSGDENLRAALERAQLLETLEALEPARRPRREARQEIASIRVDADVLQAVRLVRPFLPWISSRRDRRAREVERKVPLVGDHFDDVGIQPAVPVTDRHGDGRHADGWLRDAARSRVRLRSR